MSDNKDKAPETPPEGTKPTEPKDDGGPTQSSYDKLKAKHDSSQAELRLVKDDFTALKTKVTELEAKQPKAEDGDRITNLEVKLARAQAVSRHGLSEDDANRLKGSPDEILDDAKYWADSRKATKSVDDPKKDDSKANRDMIDDKLKQADGGNQKDPSLIPKKSDGLSWIDRYKQAGVPERYKMDEQVKNGSVDPNK